MDFGKVLARAWEITRKFKILWLFGILSGCVSGQSSYNYNSNINYTIEPGEVNTMPPEMQRFFRPIIAFFEQYGDQMSSIILITIVIGLVLLAIGFLLRVYGITGLVRSTLSIEKEKRETLTFSEINDEIKPYFWRLAGLQAIIYLGILIVAFVIFVMVFSSTILTVGIGLLCFVPLICLLVPVGWFAAVIFNQASVAMLADDLGIMDSLRAGWEIVKANLANYIVMALILMLGGALASFIISLPQMLAIAPIMAGFLSGIFGSNDWSGFFSGMWISLVCLIAYLPVLLVLRGIVSTFTNSAWVLTYLENSFPIDKPELLIPDEPEPVIGDA